MWRAFGSRWLASALVVGSLLGCERSPSSEQPPPRPPADPDRWQGPECSTAVAPRPERDAAPMCWVPAGTVTMGLPPDRAGPWDFAPRPVQVSRGFYMDQYEVTAEQFVRFAREVDNHCPGYGADDTRQGYGDRCFDWDGTPGNEDIAAMTRFPRPGQERFPVLAFWRGAMAYCEWAGKSLPTDAQWALAAFHDPATGKDRLYPWGDDAPSGITNCAKRSCQDEVNAKSAVGQFELDRSAVGVVELGGNVNEWVRDCLSRELPCAEPCVDPVVTEGCATADCHWSDGKYCQLNRGSDYEMTLEDVARRHPADLSLIAGFRCVHVTARRAR